MLEKLEYLMEWILENAFLIIYTIFVIAMIVTLIKVVFMEIV